MALGGPESNPNTMNTQRFIAGLRAYFSQHPDKKPARIGMQAGLSNATIRKIIDGSSANPTMQTAERIAAALGVPVDTIEGYAQQPRISVSVQISTPHAGFAENDAAPWQPAPSDAITAAQVLRALAPTAGNPGPWRVQRDLPHLNLQSEDILIVDRKLPPQSGHLTLGNALRGDGSSTTIIGRYLPPYLLTGNEITGATPILVDHTNVALYHPIVAMFRRFSIL